MAHIFVCTMAHYVKVVKYIYNKNFLYAMNNVAQNLWQCLKFASLLAILLQYENFLL